MLHYFQVTCKPHLDKAEEDPVRKMAFQANVGIAITEGFITKPSKTKGAVAILKAAKVDHDLLRKMMREADPELPADHPGPRPSGDAAWIDFASVEDDKGKKKGANGTRPGQDESKVCLPRVIHHNEDFFGKDGVGDQAQEALADDKPPEKTWISLPWKAWLRSDVGKNLDSEAADMSAVIMVLRGLHLSSEFVDLPIGVQTKNDMAGKRVVAVADSEAGALVLPPCVPKSSKVLKDTQSHLRVPIVVTRLYTTTGISSTYYVTPEWKTPQGDTEDLGEELGGNCTAWEFSGDETMHPFWAVARLTAQELLKRAAGNLQKRSSPFEFNMEFQVRRYQAVLAGS